MAIFVSHPFCCGLVPWQLFGYGRSDRSTKLTRGLISETPAGFRSRRGLSYDDSAPVTPHNAPFPTYKTPGVHHAGRRRGGVAARGASAAVDKDPYRYHEHPTSHVTNLRCIRPTPARTRIYRGPKSHRGFSRPGRSAPRFRSN